MPYLWLPIGILLPTLGGWLLLRIVEGGTPVLLRAERIVAGFALGTVLMPFAMFLTEITGIGSFSFLSMLLTQLVLTGVLGALWWMRCKKIPTPYSPLPTPSTYPLWQKILLGALALWFAAKCIAGLILMAGPAYFDDTMKNWNMRGKVFFVQEQLVLETIPGTGIGVGSYPQSVPLMKAWLAHLNGGWHEGLANSIHVLWYFAVIALVFFVLRRITGSTFALLGAYMLMSLPLFTVHGFTAYADLFLSLMIFLAVAWLFSAARSEGVERSSFLHIGAVTAGLLVYTKNEAILLHLPPILLLLIFAAFLGSWSTKEKRDAALWYGLSIGSVLIPWLLFKWSNGLAFGNAKPIGGQDLVWHENVLSTIFKNTFLEGNWIFLPALFLVLLVLRWKTAFRGALALPVLFVLIVIVGQLPIYIFTPLFTEAVNQTGYARGIVHLVPIVVMVTTVLLRGVVRSRNE